MNDKPTYSTWERPMAPPHPRVAAAAKWLFGVELREDEQPVGLLVGEQPGPGHNPLLPLWPYPAGSAGHRLRRMSGIPMESYLARLARVNLARRPLVGGPLAWRTDWAEHRAYQLLATLPNVTRVVLCGARARDAIAATRGVEWFEPRPVLVTAGAVVCVPIPHPSGRCREYDDPATVARAGEVVRWAAGMEET